MARVQQSDKSPFAIKPAKNGMIWSVCLRARDGRAKKVFEFASEKAAHGWINYEAKSWLKKYRQDRVI
jgi:hypothetical protein